MDQAPELQQQWYYSQFGERMGPVPYDTVYQMVISEQLSPFNLVWTEGMSEWSEIQSLATLFPVSPSVESTPSHAPRDYSDEPGLYSGMAIAAFIVSARC